MAFTKELPNARLSAIPLHLDTSALRIRRILVATDYSEPALRALEAAAIIASMYNAEITIAHATSSIAFAAGEGVVPDLLVDQALEDADRMQRLLSGVPAIASLHVETVIDDATPLAMINQLVKTRRPDLLVLGSHGPGGLERFALGSVAESAARAVAVPVLIFGPHAHTAREPFHSIVLATDTTSTGLRPAQYASSLAERFHSRLLVLHVVERKPQAISDRVELEQRLLRDMQSLLPLHAASLFEPDFRIDYGQPAARIVHASRSVHASVVVVGSRCGLGLEDHLPWMTLSQVIREAGCGVLVVRNRIT